MKVNTISFNSGIKVEEIGSLIVEIYEVIEESSKDVVVATNSHKGQ